MKRAVVFLVLAMAALGVCAAQTLVGAWADLQGNLWIFTSDGRLIIDDFDTTYTVDGGILQLVGERYDDDGDDDDPLDFDMTFYIALSDDGKNAVLRGSYTSERYFPRLHNPLLEKAEADQALNGTWMDEYKDDDWKYRYEVTFNNGVYEVSSEGEPVARGFYITGKGKLTVVITGFFYADVSEWENEVLYPVTRNYSIRGRTLTLTGGGETVLTRK
jgi:hypothetical protein